MYFYNHGNVYVLFEEKKPISNTWSLTVFDSKGKHGIPIEDFSTTYTVLGKSSMTHSHNSRRSTLRHYKLLKKQIKRKIQHEN